MIRGSVTRLPLLLAAACLAQAACGGGEPPPTPGAPVVLISIDTLRADRLPIYGYKAGRTPAIDALATDGVVLERAYTTYPLTLPAHASLLSGRYPQRHGVRDNSGFRFDAAATPPLAELLRRRGYATGGFVSAWILRGATGLASGFDVYDDEIDASTTGLHDGQRPGADTLARAVGWLDGAASKPFFLFLHLYEPHAPYKPPEPFASALADPYDGEIATADDLVGRLVAELKRRGLYDKSLVVLVADHGEGLGDHGEMRHGVLLYQETVRVPMVLKLPRAADRGTRRGEVASLTDVMPTVLGLVGAETPRGLDGVSLFARAAAGRRLYAESWYPRLRLGWSELRLLVDQRWAAIDGPAPELYDLAADPHERVDRAASDRGELAERLRALKSLDVPPAPPHAADDEEAKQLAALGYLGGSAAATKGPLPDPKTRVAVLGRLEAALDRAAVQDDAGAVAAIEQLLAENPGMVDPLPFLARSLIRLGRKQEAAAAYRRALAAGPDPQIELSLAHLLAEQGELDEAARLAESAVGGDPRRAYETLVGIADLRQDPVAAQRWVDRAIAAGDAGEPIRRRQARQLAEQGRAGEAVALLSPLAAEAGADTLAVLGLAQADNGEVEAGLATLERARRLAPTDGVVLENLGVVALRADRVPLALEALEDAAKTAGGGGSAWNSLGVARYRAGDPRGAIAAWRRAAELDPVLVDALFNLGLVAAETGDRATAQEALRRYLAGAPADRGADRARAREILAQLGARP